MWPSDLSLCNDRPRCVLRRIQNFIPIGVESYLVLWVFTDECCHPNRFRVELMLIESFEIGRLDFPNRDTLKSTHCFLANYDSTKVRFAYFGFYPEAAPDKEKPWFPNYQDHAKRTSRNAPSIT